MTDNAEVIDAATYMKDVLLPRRRLDIELGTKLWGWQLLGWCYVDRWYGVKKSPDDPYVRDCGLAEHPVYVRECQCKKYDEIYADIGNRHTFSDRKFFGHYPECMEEYPEFHTDADAMLLLMDKLSSCAGVEISLHKDRDNYRCVLTHTYYSNSDFPIVRTTDSFCDVSAPKAVVAAALSYLKKQKM